MSKILIVEDEESIAELEKDYLELSGFEVEIENDGEAGLKRAISEEFDLFILDLMLPGVDGFEICRRVREIKNTPIIMVSAKKEDIDKIRGLGLGADDYITKPFAIEELLARIRVALKKSADMAGIHPKSDVLSCGRVSLDKARHEVKVDTQLVELTHREFSLLEYLLENKNIVMSRDTLLEKVCGYDYSGETNVIDVYVRYIRTKIDDAFGIKLISTVRGVGYVIKD